MGIIDSISAAIGIGGREGPNRYRCGDCDREFEVDAPPERVVCSECRNEDVERVG